MQFWINHNGVQSGPVDLDGIKQMGLTSNAYVWHEGLSDWVSITQVPELQGLYETITQGQPIATAQPQASQTDFHQQQYDYQQPIEPEECPPTNFVWAIAATVLCCIPFGIVGMYYASKVSKLYAAGNIMGAKEASEASAWWSIASAVVGVVWRPLILTLLAT